jgi:hypothetical protein
MAHDAQGAHACDELGISDALTTVVAPDMWLITLVSASSLLSTRGSRSLGGLAPVAHARSRARYA